jgi:hypothetical protein
MHVTPQTIISTLATGTLAWLYIAAGNYGMCGFLWDIVFQEYTRSEVVR